MRVLLSAPADKPWSNGFHLLVVLRDVVAEAQLLDFRSSSDPDAELLRAVAEFRPDVHVAWKGEKYRPATLRRVRESGVFTVLWHPDIGVPDWLPPLARESDLCCVQSRGMLPLLREAGVRDPEWLMEGFTPACFGDGSLTADERRLYGCDVALIGTVDRVPGYRKRLHALNRLIREGFRVKWWGRRMSLRHNPFRDFFSPARKAWGGSMVWGETFAKACRGARIVLTMPRNPEVPGGLSNGAFTTTGVGGFYLSLYRAGMEEFFELGREVMVFRDEDEMVDQVHYYLTHEDERRAIAEAGQRRALGCYTNRHTFLRLLGLIAARGGPAGPVAPCHAELL
jgi:spore maturation protein CgeB